VADLLKDVLPVGDSVNQESVRIHLHVTAERIEQELGDERQQNLFEGSEEDWEQQPLPNGPITVGIDGEHVRAAHKQGWFELIAGKMSLLSGGRRMAKYRRRNALASCKPTTPSLGGACGNC
jgi:hypothetical protein